MLDMLKQKFSQAETHKLTNELLPELKNESCDVLVSTLALAHIKQLKIALTEWSRVLKKDGAILLTDYHPDALQKGGNRTFMHEGKQVSIRNYVHPIEELKTSLDKLGMQIDFFAEKKIDDSVRKYYEQQQALHVFDRFKGTPIIYGAYITCKHAVA
jgi:ubiquinone/menaquinone biosynthesis C-methylase UbiE